MKALTKFILLSCVKFFPKVLALPHFLQKFSRREKKKERKEKKFSGRVNSQAKNNVNFKKP